MLESPIFIVGCPRSGTGLLRDLLRSHPSISIPMESHFIAKFYRAYGDPRNDREARRLASAILSSPWVTRWGIDLDVDTLAGCRSYASIVAAVFGEWARTEGKERWGDKTPQYVLELPTLVKIFPDCKIIHIYRDGRDVTLSLLRAHLGPENVLTAAEYWKHRVITGRRVGAGLPRGRYSEVRYEDLLDDPESVLRAICRFVDEPFDAAVLAPAFLERQSRPFLFGRRDRGAVSRSAVVKTNQGKWKRDMATDDREIFESAAGELLGELGYETEGRERRIGDVERFLVGLHHRWWYFLYRINLREKHRWAAMSAWMLWAETRYRLRSAGLLSPPLATRPESEESAS